MRTFADDIARAQRDVPVANLPSNEGPATTPPATSLTQGATPPVLAGKIPTRSTAPIEANIRPERYFPKTPVAPVPPRTIVSTTLRSTPTPSALQQKNKTPNLTKEVATVARQEKPSLLTQAGAVQLSVNKHDVSDASIVTDHIRRRFSLFGGIARALGGWFQTERSRILAKPKVAIVEDPRVREQIVASAAQRGALAPQDDFGTLSERLVTVPREQKKAPGLVIKKDSGLRSSWTHIIGKPDMQPIAEPEGSLTSPTKDALPEATPVIHTPEAPPVSPIVEHAEVSVLPTAVEPAVLETQFDSAMESPSTLQDDSGDDTTETTPEPTKDVRERSSYRHQTKRPGIDTEESPLPLYATMVVVIVVSSILGIGTTLWFFDQRATDNDPLIVPADETALVRHDFALVVQTDGVMTHTDFMTLLSNSTPQQMGVTALSFDTLSEEVSWSPEKIMGLLAPHADGALTRAATDITIGYLDENRPFIVIRATSFDVAFGGMLAWETSMSADLSPVFGATILPGAKNPKGIAVGTFTDEVIGNRDFRILRDNTEATRLVYSFIDRTTLIIATTPEDVSELAARLR